MFLVLFLVVAGAILFVALQTETFQTWAAQRVTAYLSDELGTRVEIGKLKFSLVKNVTLEDVFLEAGFCSSPQAKHTPSLPLTEM